MDGMEFASSSGLRFLLGLAFTIKNGGAEEEEMMMMMNPQAEMRKEELRPKRAPGGEARAETETILRMEDEGFVRGVTSGVTSEALRDIGG
jgi:hypothetical protein